jgi:ABC-type amino acid transport substrate-binding protein
MLHKQSVDQRGWVRVHQRFSPWAVVAALVLLFPLVGCQGSTQDPTWQRIQQQGVMRVGMDPNWLPFEYIDGDGKLAGFDVELALELGRRMGLEVQFVANLSFDGLYDALTAGLVDVVISAVIVDPGRSADFAYTTPYFDAGLVLVARADGVGVEGMQDLNHKVLAVELGSDGDTVARRWKRRLEDLTLLHSDTAESALIAVAEGQAHVALCDRASALMVLKRSRQALDSAVPSTTLTIRGSPITPERYAAVIRWESRQLLRRLNRALVEMEEDMWLAHLEQTWLGP